MPLQVANSLRHTEGGYIRISAEVVDQNHVALSVIDSGSGIHADVIEDIFVGKNSVDESTAKVRQMATWHLALS